jgi:hypothetical protein
VIVAWHPAEARRFLEDAERLIAHHAGHRLVMHPATPDIARALARLDPGRAEAMACRIGNLHDRDLALSSIVEELADTDLAKAEYLAQKIGNPDYRAKAQAHLATMRAGSLS